MNNKTDVMKETSGWMQTASNTVVSFSNPDPEAFDINDIALGLSRQPRYSGQGAFFYSVAQHSIYAATLASDEAKIYALLHDAPEAYTGDIPAPLKEMLGQKIFRIESKLECAIYKGLGIDPYPNTSIQDEVYTIDKSLLEPEYKALFSEHIWNVSGVKPAGIRIAPWSIETAMYWFLVCYFSIRATDREAMALAEDAIRKINNAHSKE